ncbi:MAG: EAL domain-containing protein [Pseudomonadota bacterium]
MQTSIRTNMVVAIGLMGLLGLASALVTGEIFRHHAIENQRDALRTLVQHEVATQLSKLVSIGREFSSAQQKEDNFLKARATNDIPALGRSLDDQFFQYYITARVLSVARLYILDQDVQVITASNQGRVDIVAPEIVCPKFIARARARHGAERVQIMHEFCVYNKEGFYVMMFPIGGLVPKGYFLIIAEPDLTLIKIETPLGLPIRIVHPSGEISLKSAAWPTATQHSDLLLTDAEFHSPEGDSALRVDAASDISSLNTSLQHTRLFILGGVTVLSLLAAAFALGLLNRSLLDPLSMLTKHLRVIRSDNSRLGDELPLSGNHEVRELIADFNLMATELKSLYKKMQTMAFTDSLTMLPNRSLLHEALNFQASAAKKKGLPFALLMMDMDRFKAINDTLGHHVGDNLLQQIGRRLEKALRKTDTIARIVDLDVKRLDQETIARLGGDEFAAVLPGVGTRAEASIVLEKILREMNEVLVVDGYNVSVSISIGIAFCPTDGADPSTLMRCADIAMYQAKQKQQGYAFYESSQDTHSVHSLTMESELQKAIERDSELVLYFQPKLALATHSICGVEALIYWQHPEKGLVPPNEFIPIAEESGLIVSLTTWVLHRAAQQRAYIQSHSKKMNIAINISARCLQNDTILDQLDQIIRMYNIPPADISLELTETAVMADVHRSLQLLQQLDKRGVLLSLDDFGAGYTSLHYLKVFPMDEIKIDRSFVKDMVHDQQDAAIVRSVIELAHNMGLKVVAEGVEDAPTLKQLQQLNCDYVQGYHIARPMLADELVIWLKNSPYNENAITHSSVPKNLKKRY